jgi:hypothetical protein
LRRGRIPAATVAWRGRSIVVAEGQDPGGDGSVELLCSAREVVGCWVVQQRDAWWVRRRMKEVLHHTNSGGSGGDAIFPLLLTSPAAGDFPSSVSSSDQIAVTVRVV